MVGIAMILFAIWLILMPVKPDGNPDAIAIMSMAFALFGLAVSLFKPIFGQRIVG